MNTTENRANGANYRDDYPTLKLAFDNVHADNSSLAEDWELLLRVVADFEVSVDENVIYAELEFCVVEFGVQAIQWSRRPFHGDFIYRTMEAEEPGLVFIKKQEGGWQIGSIHQTSEAQPLSLAIVRAAVDDYWHRLRKIVGTRFQRDIETLVTLPARRFLP